jgi:lipopolysaccharide/colanic/teichoic acid biosynthesis glycosyltransferase
VTRVGRFIRKTSIDELPQLFNVLKGNLSLVGPRPHATHAKAHRAALRRCGRGLFRPPQGQARHHRLGPDQWLARRDRHEDKIQRRVEHDLYYIENWSVLLDLYILIKTPFSLMTKNENAY